MNTTILTAVAALVIGLGAGYVIADGKTSVATHVMPDGSSMKNAMAEMTGELEGKTGDEFDKAFIQEMVTHHEGAVAMAEMALEHATHSEIKDMAQDIISAQMREITTMRAWLQAWYGVQP